MSIIPTIIFTAILIFSLATMLYSSGEMAFFISLGIVALLFLWDVSNNQGQLMLSPIISIGPWLGIRLWTALFLYLSLLGGYVFGNVGKAIVLVVLILIVFYSLGLLGPIAHGDLGAIKEAVQVGGG